MLLNVRDSAKRTVDDRFAGRERSAAGGLFKVRICRSTCARMTHEAVVQSLGAAEALDAEADADAAQALLRKRWSKRGLACLAAIRTTILQSRQLTCECA